MIPTIGFFVSAAQLDGNIIHIAKAEHATPRDAVVTKVANCMIYLTCYSARNVVLLLSIALSLNDGEVCCQLCNSAKDELHKTRRDFYLQTLTEISRCTALN
jgi:hypothetical protein